MGDTNQFSGIVKLLETPKQSLINSKNWITTCRVELPQKRKNKLIRLVFWGNLGREASRFYNTNDYILIEGYISLRPYQKIGHSNRISKQVTVTIFRVYPILLNSNRNPN